MILAVVAYFTVACLGLVLVLSPHTRERTLGWALRLASGGAAASQRLLQGGQRGAGRAAHSVGEAASYSASWLAKRRRFILLGAGPLVVAPLVPLVLWRLDSSRLDGYDHRLARQANEQVADLLHGENLAPPPPVPPELFTTLEVELARPQTRGASRQWELLDAEFRQRLLVVFKLMHERHGYDMVLLEGYRSPERQNQLAALGQNVTRAGAFESYHQYGLAADCAFLRDGHVVISERDAWAASGYARYGELALELGLGWGGAWRSIKDYGHVELRRAGVLGQPATVPN